MKSDREKCLYCGACVGVCPANAIFLNETYITFSDACTNCGICERACPVNAISRGD